MNLVLVVVFVVPSLETTSIFFFLELSFLVVVLESKSALAALSFVALVVLAFVALSAAAFLEANSALVIPALLESLLGLVVPYFFWL